MECHELWQGDAPLRRALGPSFVEIEAVELAQVKVYKLQSASSGSPSVAATTKRTTDCLEEMERPEKPEHKVGRVVAGASKSKQDTKSRGLLSS